MTQMPQAESPARSRIVLLLPLVLFLALAALLLIRLGSGDPSRIPSALIGKPAPPGFLGLGRFCFRFSSHDVAL
jgi:cytochrome c biogenesis protein CcmG, thiol:disulfide interchange protein DsbE